MLYKWRVTEPRTGKRYQARHYMTEEEALKLDPRAEKVPGSEFEPKNIYDPNLHTRMNTTDDEREAFEERAAIMEYCGEMTRREAERRAMEGMRKDKR